MFERLSTGWALSKQSFRVVLLDKEMLLFPLLSGIACLCVLASFALPLWNSPWFQTVIDEEAIPQDPIAYLVLFAFYFGNYFVIVFFNSALIACAIKRFRGGDPTLGDGLRAASARLPQIAGWALLSATVGVILKMIESRSERVGQIVAGLLGAGWAIATFFVVPVLVVERVGPIEATRRSFAILRKSWGEALAGKVGIGLIVFVATIPALVGIFTGIFLVASNMVSLGIVCLTLSVLWILFVSLVSSTVQTVLVGALYLYAEGETPRQFDESLLRQAFYRKSP